MFQCECLTQLLYTYPQTPPYTTPPKWNWHNKQWQCACECCQGCSQEAGDRRQDARICLHEKWVSELSDAWMRMSCRQEGTSVIGVCLGGRSVVGIWQTVTCVRHMGNTFKFRNLRAIVKQTLCACSAKVTLPLKYAYESATIFTWQLSMSGQRQSCSELKHKRL